MNSNNKKKYNALILAGGKGERLKKKFKNTPKVLINLKKKKCSLDYNLLLLKKIQIKNIFVNISENKEKFFSYKRKNNLNFKFVLENKLYGTAQSAYRILKKTREKYSIILYGDNISNLSLKKVINFHEKRKSNFTIVSNKSDNLKNSGVLTISKKNILKKIEEKNKKIKQKIGWVNSGIYIINHNLILKIKSLRDFAYDFIPYLLAKKYKINVYKYNSKIFTIDTPALYDFTIKKLMKKF